MDSFDEFDLKLLKGDRQQKAKYKEKETIQVNDVHYIIL